MTSRQFMRQPVSSIPPSASTLIQRRPLAVNKPGDRLEREAERVAETVMSGRPAPFTLSAVPITRVQREEAPKEKTDAEKLKEAGDKLKDAFLETPLGKELVEKVKQDKLVKGATEAGRSFIGTLPGKIITGAAAAGAVATLAATHKELPAQIPEIPLDVLTPGLSVEITYKGPVDKPTEAMITFKFTEQAPKGSGDKKPAATESEKYRAETARIAADQARFRAGLKYPPGSPEDLRQKAEADAVKSVAAKYAGGPDVDAIIKKYQGLGTSQPKGGLQLTDPALSFGYKPPALLGDEYKIKLPGEQKKKDDEPVLQRQASSAAAVDVAPPVVHDVLQSPGQPLDTGTRAFMEQRFGHDFGQVRVHTDSRATESAQAVNALAYTVGTNIVFAPGQFAPGTQAGRRLLAHELAHVFQQGGGVSTSTPAVGQRLQMGRTDVIFGSWLMRQTTSVSAPAGEAPHPTAALNLDYRALADQIHTAIAGWGTDEEAVYRALQQLRRDPSSITQLRIVYADLHHASLEADIRDDFSGSELEYALQLMNLGDSGSKQRITRAPGSPAEFQEAARRIRDAVEGMGTDEEAIFAVLVPLDHNPNLTNMLQNAYFELYGEDLRDRLTDEMSGSELRYALDLLETPYQHYVQEANDLLAGGHFKGRIGFGYSWDSRDWYDNEYWIVADDPEPPKHKLIQIKGKPHEALDALYTRQERWHVDCAEFVQVVQWYALRHSLGADEFDKRIGAGRLELKTRKSSGIKTQEVYERTGPEQPRMKGSSTGQEDPRPVDQILRDAPIGSRVRWTNQTLFDRSQNLSFEEYQRYNGRPPWSGFIHENATKLGPENFSAHGFEMNWFSRLVAGPTRSYARSELEQKMVDFTTSQLDDVNANEVRRGIYISQIEYFDVPQQ